MRTVTEGASLTNAYSKRDTSSESESGLCLAPEKMKQKSKLLLKQHLRKQRRCWSPELHRRFIHALEHLGGSQGQLLEERAYEDLLLQRRKKKKKKTQTRN